MSVLYKELRNLPNGARFYSADLHVHSYGASHDIKDPAMTAQAIIDQAVVQKLGVLAITDHNSIENCQASLDYAQKYAGQLLVLAGVEITTANGHLLVYFPPDGLAALRRFLAQTSIVNEGTPDSHTAMSMANVATLAGACGGICIAAHIDREKTGFERLAAGYPNWKKDIITSPSILGVEVDDPTNLVWYSDDDVQTQDGAERRKLLAQRAQTPGASSRAVLAHLQNSDAHTLGAFISAGTKRTLTRLKMDDLSFASFRTALADPDARVRVAVTLPPTVPRVLAVSVQGGFLDSAKYRLSDNLTCFIGGRGTGKSTALRCIGHALGVETDIENYDNCPDSVVVYCRDAQGILYRYERMRGQPYPEVRAAEGKTEIDVPLDSFRIEYYGQGDLARVAEDPLNKAHLLQEFLDRHTRLSDLRAREDDVLGMLRENGLVLRPLEDQAAGRPGKKKEVDDCDRKLKVAEEGKLKDIVAEQAAVGAQKGLCETVSDIGQRYAKGLSLRGFRHDFSTLEGAAGLLPGHEESLQCRTAVRRILEAANENLVRIEKETNAALKSVASELEEQLQAFKKLHSAYDVQLAAKIGALQSAGLSASVADLNRLITTRTRLNTDIARIDQQAADLKRLREERKGLLTTLKAIREEAADRRKRLVTEVNKHLADVIDDYVVVVYYEQAGLIADFFTFVRRAMQGTHFPEQQAQKLCHATTPQELASLLATKRLSDVAKFGAVGDDWAKRLHERLGDLPSLHELEMLWKPARPTIKVLTKTNPPKQIPVNQLSDGQRHTILLTIAMLAESQAPLVIDQPEDDLDNAFIFSSIVRMLRTVKERRQVILVTHNANIAVLGDAELLFPLRRAGERGEAFDAGSIDRPETKQAVQRILEGGETAFLRRKEVYGH